VFERGRNTLERLVVIYRASHLSLKLCDYPRVEKGLGAKNDIIVDRRLSLARMGEP